MTKLSSAVVEGLKFALGAWIAVTLVLVGVMICAVPHLHTLGWDLPSVLWFYAGVSFLVSTLSFMISYCSEPKP